jgi:CDP-diacylglycerol--glycerol-3-phosphate 3-phosphatidyltransferase
MNLPNQLTVSRFVLTAAFLVALFIEFQYNTTVALVFFVAASITDWMDGAIARRRNLITSFGTLMDPLADKILTCCAFIALVGRGDMPAWMAALIVSRELAITGLRLLAASKSVVLPAEAFGKHKTIWQIITIIAALGCRGTRGVGGGVVGGGGGGAVRHFFTLADDGADVLQRCLLSVAQSQVVSQRRVRQGVQ